jgi:hypothetical protein
MRRESAEILPASVRGYTRSDPQCKLKMTENRADGETVFAA